MSRVAAMLLLLSLAPGLAPAGGEEVFARLEAAASAVSTIQSRFVQEKHLAMFQEVLISEGRFFYEAPHRLRWELLEPVRTGFSLDGDKGRRWHERAGGEEPLALASDPGLRALADQMLAWTRVDLAWLEERYRIEVLSERPAVLRLTPRTPGAEAVLDHLRIAFAGDDRHLETLEIHEPGGDFTRVRFLETAIDEPLPQGIF